MQTDYGFLYALTNAAMPGHIKIGMTRRRPEERVAELSSATGVPVEFKLAYSRAFENAPIAERMVHDRLEEQGLRVSQGREFFQLSVEAATAAIDEVAARLATDDTKEHDRERFAEQADLILAEDRPSLAQLERALSYLEYAAELDSPVDRYRAGVLAHDLAIRRAADSAKGQAYLERAHALYEQAGLDGVLRAHSQRAILYLQADDTPHAQSALADYLLGMPSEGLPPAELDYLLTSLHDDWHPYRRALNLLEQLHPWRAQLWKEAQRRYAKDDPFLPWLQKQTHTANELLLERVKLPLMGVIALVIMYLTNPAALYLLAIACAVCGYFAWKWKRKAKAKQGRKRK